MPPAFNLSQDQTLEFNHCFTALPCFQGVALKIIDWMLKSFRFSFSIRLFRAPDFFERNPKVSEARSNQMLTLIGSLFSF